MAIIMTNVLKQGNQLFKDKCQILFMKIEKHEEALDEVYKTIETALNDSNGLLGHQRRISSMLSMGSQQMIELYFHKLHIIKPGTQLKHEWFKLDDKNIKNKLLPILTTDADKIEKINEILFLARRIEADRNDLVYGAPLENDKKLKEKIDAFLELKDIIME